MRSDREWCVRIGNVDWQLQPDSPKVGAVSCSCIGRRSYTARGALTASKSESSEIPSLKLRFELLQTILPWVGSWLVVACSALQVHAQSTQQVEPGVARLRSELDRLAGICDSLQLPSEARLARKWIAPEREDQQVLYLPVALLDESVASQELASLAKHFNAARRRYAAFLFERVREMASGDEHAAYNLLWQVVREDPGNEEAKKLLGPLARTLMVRPRLTRSRAPHPAFGWPAGSYSTVQTPHFRLTSRAGAKESVELAERLEEVYALWTQVFYPIWAPPGQLPEMIAGSRAAWPRHNDIEVYLLKDREDYVTALGVGEANIGASVGYYNPNVKKSFFYQGNALDETLVHELTHQLLMEATRINALPSAGNNGGIWQLEGIALYMESLAKQDNFWTLGGLESPRMQTARYRAVRDGYWPSWTSFANASVEEWKRDPEIALKYSHAAGLSHLLLNRLGVEARKAYFRELVAIYQNSATPGSLLGFLGADEEVAKMRYQDLMVVTGEQLKSLAAADRQPEDLVLCASELTAEQWSMLSDLNSLRWLDLSFSNVGDQNLAWLDSANSITRLGLEGTEITGELLPTVAKLPNLQELDLTGCRIDDQGLLFLENHPKLEILWLGETQITAASLRVLATIKNLQQCTVQGSQISDQQWQAFLTLHPELR